MMPEPKNILDYNFRVIIKQQTAFVNDCTIAIGSHCRVWTKPSCKGTGGSYSSVLPVAYEMLVIFPRTALHAKFTMCGKHLKITY